MSPRFLPLLVLLYFPASVLAQVAAPAAPAAVAAPAAAPVVAPAPDFGGNVLQMFLGLAVVLALLVGGLWLLKQLTQRRGESGGLLRVVSGTAVGPRERVVIVEVGSTWLVLGVAPGRVSALAEVPRQALPPTPERRPASADFPGWLRNITGAPGGRGGNNAPRR